MGATDWQFGDKCELSEAETATIELAVCGAHMSDLPLNKDLTSRGATFLRTAKSAADYKFYALAGGPPSRPGMVKCEKGAGGEIELEIWSMPIEKFGSFMKTIPAPLAIGSVNLSDGSQVNGFICEAAGAEGGEDITHLGDWRQYIK